MLQRVLAQNPFDRDAVLQLSFLHLDAEALRTALQTLEPYIKAAPDDARALNNQGLALRGLKRLDEARRSFKRARKHSADDPLILTNFGAVLVDLGRASEARPLHEQALRGAPGDPRLLANYGICLAALGEKDRARETLDNALAADPEQRRGAARPREPRRMSAGADHLAEVQGRIAEAAKAAGRRPGRGHPGRRLQDPCGAERVRELLEAGQRVFGENRVQEAEEKFPALKADYPDLELHLIGPLQTNKARDAVALFDVIQSVDREAPGRGAGQGDGARRQAAGLLHPGQYRRGAAEGGHPAGRSRRLRRRLPRRAQAAGRRPDVHPAGRRGAGAALRPAGQDGRAQRADRSSAWA